MSWQIDNASKYNVDLIATGQGQQTPTNSNLYGLLQQFAGNAGIQTGQPQQNQAMGQGQSGPVTVGGVPQGQQAPPVNPANAGAYNQLRQNNQQQAGQQSQEQNQNPNNPYSLDTNQQQLLNQQIDTIHKQAQTDIGQFQQSMASRGITDPAAMNAGVEQLKEHYNALSTETSTQFYQQVQQQKQKELAALISTYTGLQEGGIAGLTQAGQIHEQGARADANFGYQILGDLLGGVGGIAGLSTGVPGGGQTAPIAAPIDYGQLLSGYGVGSSDMFSGGSTDPTMNPAGGF